MKLALALIVGVGSGVSAFADPVTEGGVGLEQCYSLVSSQPGSEFERKALDWSHGYWTGFNMYLAADCRNKRDIGSLLMNDAAAIRLLRATCEVEPNWTIMIAAFNILIARAQVAESMSAACTDRGEK